MGAAAEARLSGVSAATPARGPQQTHAPRVPGAAELTPPIFAASSCSLVAGFAAPLRAGNPKFRPVICAAPNAGGKKREASCFPFSIAAPASRSQRAAEEINQRFPQHPLATYNHAESVGELSCRAFRPST